MATPNDDAWSVAWDPETKVFSVQGDGKRHHFHTDPEESAAFVSFTSALRAGSLELAQLVGSMPATAEPDELKRVWLEKVTAAGLDRQIAADWLAGRLAAGGVE